MTTTPRLLQNLAIEHRALECASSFEQVHRPLIASNERRQREVDVQHARRALRFRTLRRRDPRADSRRHGSMRASIRHRRETAAYAANRDLAALMNYELADRVG